MNRDRDGRRGGRARRVGRLVRFGRFARADRAVSPTVGKALELGVVVLYVSLLVTALYGGVVPTYRTAAGDELADRTLAAAADRIEAAVPEDAARVRRTVRLDPPETLRGTNYYLRVRDRTLALDHPHPDVGGETRLALPADAAVSGNVSSRADVVVVVAVRSNATGATVRLGARR